MRLVVRLLFVKANAEGFKAQMLGYALIFASFIKAVKSFINAVARNTFSVACFMLAVKSFMFAVSSFTNQDDSFITAVTRYTFAVANLTNAVGGLIKQVAPANYAGATFAFLRS